MDKGYALGMIEALGFTTAAAALDSALKAAEVTCVGVEKVIGTGKMISVTLHLAGEVAAVKAAVEAGEAAGKTVGSIASAFVIPRPHEEVQNLIEQFK